MRIDLIGVYPFTAAANNAVLADKLNIKPYNRISIACVSTSVTGTPTSWVFHFYQIEKNSMTVVGEASGLQCEPNSSAPGVDYIDQAHAGVALQVLTDGPSFENCWEMGQVVLTFSGGTSPTLTGTVYVWGRID